MATDEASVVSNGPTGTVRDKDPPPSFDGSNPDGLKQYPRELELWKWETDIPKLKHAVKVLRQLNSVEAPEQQRMRCPLRNCSQNRAWRP